MLKQLTNGRNLKLAQLIFTFLIRSLFESMQSAYGWTLVSLYLAASHMPYPGKISTEVTLYKYPTNQRKRAHDGSWLEQWPSIGLIALNCAVKSQQSFKIMWQSKWSLNNSKKKTAKKRNGDANLWHPVKSLSVDFEIRATERLLSYGLCHSVCKLIVRSFIWKLRTAFLWCCLSYCSLCL